MSTFRRGGKWVSKFYLAGTQHWTPGGPWERKTHAIEAERRYRDRLTLRRSDETCASFAERWMNEWPRDAASTRRLYQAAADRFAEHFGSTLVGDVERLSARSWALTVPRSVSRVIGTMYEDARNVGLVESNPFSNLRLPSSERTATIDPPSMEEYRRLLSACDVLDGYGPEFKAMIQFSAWTGIRQGEMFALQWQDVEEDEIRVVRARKVDGTLGPPKNGQADKMPFLPPARVLDDVPRWEDSPFVFHSPRGRPLIRGTFAWSWQKVRANARVQARWHSLRHFCATQLLELGYSHFDVSVQLRHTDGGFQVQSRYGHPSRDAARKRLLAGFEFPSENIGSELGSKAADNG